MSSPLKLLILEDRASDAELMLAELRRVGFEPDWQRVDAEKDFIAALDPSIDLILADYHLPQFDAQRALQLLQERGLKVPFILVSGMVGEEIAVDMIKQGATDYVIKDRMARLGQSVIHALDEKRMRDEKQQTEEALHIKDMAIESSINAIAISDFEGNLTYVNSAFLNLWGYSDAQEVLGKPSVEFWEVQEKAAEVLAAVQNLEGWIGELPARKKDGSLFDAQVSASMILDKAGRPLSVMAAFIDITERKRAEEVLKISEGRLREAQRIGHIGYLDLDLITNKMQWSEETFRIHGVNPEEFSPTFESTAQCLHPEDKPRVDEQVKATMRGESSFNSKHRIVRPDGSVAYVHALADVIADAHGNPIRMMGTVQDITERKHAEEALQASEQTARQRAEQLRLVNQISSAVASGLDLERLLQTLYEECQHIGDADTFFVALYDEGTGSLSFPVYYKDGERRRLATRNVRENSGLAGYIIETRQTVYIRDQEDLPSGIKLIRQPGNPTSSYVGIPLIMNKQVVGIFSLQSHKLDAYTPAMIQTLELLAIPIAIAIRNSQLYEQTQSEKNLANALIDNIPGIFFLVNQQGKFVRWNKKSELLWDYTQEEIKDLNIAALVVEEEQAHPAGLFNKVLGTEPTTTETQLVAKGGRRIPIILIATRIQMGDEQCILGIGVDIAERKQAEEALKRLSQHNELILNSVAEGILGLDLQGNHTFVNPAAARLLGYTAEELLGRRSHSLWHHTKPDGSPFPLEECAIYSTFRNGQEHRISTEVFWRKDGTSFPVEYASTPVYQQGQLAGAVLTFEDINERKQAETALMRLKIELEERVAQRTIELSNANANLAKIAKLKDEFLASMSHELRTPLTGVLGLTEALQRRVYGELNTRQLETLRTVEESGRHLLNLINDILDLSKIEAGRMELELSRINMDDLCQASLRLVKPMAAAKHQSVAFDMKPTGVTIRADARRLKQVLFNLLGNAIKFTPEGGELGLEVEGDREHDEIHLSVWDRGIGISEEDLARLFQPFVQLDSGLARNYPGTGLGLSLVHRLVELHNGRINLESTVGQGSRFTVTIPWLKSDTASLWQGDLATIPSASKPIKADSQGTKRTIMLADDNEVNLQVISDFLTSQGYGVVLTRNGQQALETIPLVKPDLVLMDIQMPGMDGLEAIRRVRSLPDPVLARLPVIALTALAMSGDHERCLEAGANYYLSKPVRLGNLIEIIQSVLEMTS